MTKLFKVLVTENVTLGKELYVEAEDRAMVEAHQDEIMEYANEAGDFEEESYGMTVDAIEEFTKDVALAPDITLPLSDTQVFHIETEYGAIEVTKGGRGATVSLPDVLGNPNADNGLDTVVSMILGHVSAGVDVTTEAYAQGVNMAFQAIENQE